MADIKLTAKPRTEFKKGPGRRLRMQGLVPAVVYGGKKDPENLTIEAINLEALLRQGGAHAIVDITIEGGEVETAMVREVQRHPVSAHIVHADLQRVQADKKIHTTVAVKGVGTPVGVREGGLLEHPEREVEIRCLPADLPRVITAAIEGLKMQDSFRAGDLALGEKIELLTDPETVLFHVAAPRAVEEPIAGEEGEEAEGGGEGPEVIGEKKETDEESSK
jgi:large subunit ribosomal protein L25